MSDAANATSGFADIDGTRLYYETAGTGQPLVLLHAGIADSCMWNDQFTVFAQHYRVIRYDLRGFGKSDAPPESFSNSTDLYKLLQFLGIDRAALIGVSMGGSTIIDFALEHSEMVTALIPVCAGLSGYTFQGEMPPVWSDILAEDAAIEALFKQGDTEQATARSAELDMRVWFDGLERTPHDVDPAIRARALEMALLTYQHVGVERMEQPLEPPAATRLADIIAPTLVIVGAGDLPSIREIADQLEAGIPGARKVVMPVVAHLPNMERPDEFNQHVLGFLQEVL